MSDEQQAPLPGFPTHPDHSLLYALLESLALEQEERTVPDYQAVMAAVVDPASLLYVATHRGMEVTGLKTPEDVLGENGALLRAAVILYQEGFLVGARWQKNKESRDRPSD